MIIEGTVEHGDARGRQLGFRTANVPIGDARIEDGVWAATIELENGQWAVAAVSIGRRSTFYANEGQRLLEAHLLDFEQDLYGQSLRIHLGSRLRGQRTFHSSAALIEQMHQDVSITRSWATAHHPWLLSTNGHFAEAGA